MAPKVKESSENLRKVKHKSDIDRIGQPWQFQPFSWRAKENFTKMHNNNKRSKKCVQIEIHSRQIISESLKIL